MYVVVVQKFTFAISSPDEFLLIFGGLLYQPPFTDQGHKWCTRADQGLHLQAKCVHCVDFWWPKKTQFWANFDIFGGSCTDPLLPMRAKFGGLEQTQGLHLPAKFHLNVFIVSASGGQKLHFLGKFWHCLGLLYRRPFTDDGQMWCAIADPWSTLTRQISYRSVYSVALWRRKKTIFANFCDFLDFGI